MKDSGAADAGEDSIVCKTKTNNSPPILAAAPSIHFPANAGKNTFVAGSIPASASAE